MSESRRSRGVRKHARREAANLIRTGSGKLKRLKAAKPHRKPMRIWVCNKQIKTGEYKWNSFTLRNQPVTRQCEGRNVGDYCHKCTAPRPR